MFDAKRFFKVAVTGILEQGRKCKTSESGFCCYKNDKGERCVVGHSIPPDKYESIMDNEDFIESQDKELRKILGEDCEEQPGIYAYQNPFVLAALQEEYGGPFTQSDLDLLRDMQETHDEDSVSDWPELFRKTEVLFFGEESSLCGLKESA